MGSNIKPEIAVEVSLLPTERGGRQNPISEGEYRCVLSVGEENFSARFYIPQQGLIFEVPRKLYVQFLYPEMALPFFSVGTSFSVWEGKIIGNGKVIEVL